MRSIWPEIAVDCRAFHSYAAHRKAIANALAFIWPPAVAVAVGCPMRRIRNKLTCCGQPSKCVCRELCIHCIYIWNFGDLSIHWWSAKSAAQFWWHHWRFLDMGAWMGGKKAEKAATTSLTYCWQKVCSHFWQFRCLHSGLGQSQCCA